METAENKVCEHEYVRPGEPWPNGILCTKCGHYEIPEIEHTWTPEQHQIRELIRELKTTDEFTKESY